MTDTPKTTPPPTKPSTSSSTPKTKPKTKKKVNKQWLADHMNDPYVKMAQRDGYRARAAYKLKEIDEVFKLVKPGQVVVDLGSTPGAWSQYLRRKMSPDGAAVGELNGLIFAMDLLPMEPIEGVDFLLGDIREDAVLVELQSRMRAKGIHMDAGGRAVDLVVSDMAPNLSGIESADSARIEHLVELAIDFSAQHLVSTGALVCKVFHGSGYSQLVEMFKKQFKVVKAHKPKSSRDRSSETFLVGVGLKTLPGTVA
jgi:23S rRNA (uridine2552-2'-O)-methyltransferase